MSAPEWRTTEVVAWTEREGPGRPPPGPSTWMWTATAATLGVVLSVIFMTDALCPEHRAWVQSLALLAFFGSVTAIVGLIRGWAVAPLLTIGAAVIGMAIGTIDAAHAPIRGGVISVGFGVALVFSAWLALRQLPVTAWDRQVRRDATSSPTDAAPPAEARAALQSGEYRARAALQSGTPVASRTVASPANEEVLASSE